MLRAGLLAVSLTLLGWATPGAAAQPSLVKDVNPDPVDPLHYAPGLSGFTSVGPRAVFLLSRSEENAVGSELWTTDGTDAGTERLRSFLSSASLINGFQATVAGGNGRIAFVFVPPGLSSPPPGPVASLWRTDGTAAGTFPLARMFTSFGSSVVHAGALFFAGCSTETDCEPWVSDGTVGGTRKLRDITPGEYGSDPRGFLSVGGSLYFFASTPGGPGLWRTDGTRPGTRRVALLPLYSTPGNLAAAGSRLFFTVGPDAFPDSKKSLWTSDGTAAGTLPLPPFDLARGRGPAVSRLLGAVGGFEYFGGVDPVLGLQLYRTDGEPGGTRRLTSFPRSQGALSDGTALSDRLLFVGPGGKLWTSRGTRASTGPLAGCTGGCPEPYLENGSLDRVVNGGLAFFSGSVGGDVEPWVTDGTPGGTRRLLQSCVDGSCGSYPEFGPVIRGQVSFEAAGDLWSTDGTAAGTRVLGAGALLFPEGSEGVAAAGPRVVFAGFDKSNNSVDQLKSVEGTPESERVLDLRLNDGVGSSPRSFTALGDDVLFFACSPLGVVWKTRGTPETTVPLADAQGVCDDESPRSFVILDGVAYFLAVRPGDYWDELWRTDGTPAGTWQITHLGPARYVTTLTRFQGKLLFAAQDLTDDPSTARSAAWTSDGTAAGTAELFELPARYAFSLVAFGDMVYFEGRNTTDSIALYVSDGTLAGTRELTLADADAATAGFFELGGAAFFLNGDGVWQTDGTPEGTRQLVPPGDQVQSIHSLAQLGGRLYFIGLDITDPERGQGIPTLFQSDGTAAGTVRLKTFGGGLTFYPPESPLAAAAGALFFAADDGGHGTELWKTDGTAAGTVLVSDIDPGPESSRISSLTSTGDGRIFFAADDGEHGVELWTSDGTAAGTRRLSDLAPGPLSSNPREPAAIGDRLFFSADDGATGREPWVLPLDPAHAGKGKP